MSQPKLFSPVQLGRVRLAHRVVLAPLTRQRADAKHVHSELAVEYYEQRASVSGTLLISEGTLVAAKASGVAHVPGIWNDKQIAAWKRITDAVHAKGSYMYCQLWAVGRNVFPDVLEEEGFPYVSASNIPLKELSITPRPLSLEEIKEYVQLFATAAINAVDRAGFDGVEVHCANGYLIDQFIQDVSNNRTDEYGGSVANRCRFALEVIDAVCKAVGEDRTGVRVSPWSEFGDMGMENPEPTFSYFARELVARHPKLAYLHATEPRISGAVDRQGRANESNDFLRDIWSPRPFISAGGFTRESALEVAEEKGDIVAFGRWFISNPDLPLRLRKNIPLTKYNRATFYSPGLAEGYTDYPFAGSLDIRKEELLN
ncbi:hypothetical protein NM688_g6184 [Phlebia brevispora]|uniref:Uncharacterized protein n=1 Tax=Phlebia brevispora TaxID=194682 RepID=A0ACC1SJ33_9APHY|nr:hypothetical protein NM688_g6184 [Phlebia brevispora]